jgi:hypothetical protein
VFEVGEAVYVELVEARLVPALHAPLLAGLEYHSYEYVGVPPPSWDVRTIDCPLSMFGAAGVTAPAERAALIVTVGDAPDVCISGVVALSVAFNSKL